MSKHHRTTRTAKLNGGRLDGTVLQLRIGDTTAGFAMEDSTREVYAGSPLQHDGYIELSYIGTVGADGTPVVTEAAAS